jgi:hypothetical protein
VRASVLSENPARAALDGLIGLVLSRYPDDCWGRPEDVGAVTVIRRAEAPGHATNHDADALDRATVPLIERCPDSF